MKKLQSLKKVISIILVLSLVFNMGLFTNLSANGEIYAEEVSNEETNACEVCETECSDEVENIDETENIDIVENADETDETCEETESDDLCDIEVETESSVVDENNEAEVETESSVADENDETEVEIESSFAEETYNVLETTEGKDIIATDSDICEVLEELEEENVATVSEICEVDLSAPEIYYALYDLDNDSVTFENDKIILQKDIYLNDTICVTSDAIIDLNTHTIYGATNKTAFNITTNNFRICNLNYEKFGSVVGNSETPVISINGGNVDLFNVIIKNDYYKATSTIDIIDSNVNLFNTTVFGANGRDSKTKVGTNGSNAMTVYYSSNDYKLTIENSSIIGGQGGKGVIQEGAEQGFKGLRGLPLIINDRIYLDHSFSDGYDGELGGGNGGMALVIEKPEFNLDNINIIGNCLRGGNAGNKNEKSNTPYNVIRKGASGSASSPAFNSVDAGYVKRVADQSYSSLCMTFGVLGVAETYMSKKYPDYVSDLGYEVGKLDLSEDAFAYVLDHGQTDPLGNAGRGTHNTGRDYRVGGTNTNMLTAILAKWWGPIEEKKAPWQEYWNPDGTNTIDNHHTPDESVLVQSNNVAKLVEVDSTISPSRYNTRDEFFAKTKEEIVENGALLVGCSLPAASTNTSLNDRYEYIKNKYSGATLDKINAYKDKYSFAQQLYIYDENHGEGGGHSFSIIGWDDNFPKEYFNGKYQVEQYALDDNGVRMWDYEKNDYKKVKVEVDAADISCDGAILCRNSWFVDEFQWFPYDFAFKYTDYTPFKFAPFDTNEHLYYYDGGTYIQDSKQLYKIENGVMTALIESMANIFKIQGNESIKAISYDFNANENMNLRIYEVEDNTAASLDKVYNENDSTKLLYSQDDIGASEFKEITLNETVPVEEGTYVAVVLEPQSVVRNGVKYYNRASVNFDMTSTSGTEQFTTVDKKSSYIKTVDNTGFKYISEVVPAVSKWGYPLNGTPANLCLRMITEDSEVANYTLTINANGGKFKDNTSTRNVTVASNKTLSEYTEFEEPTKDGCIFDKWVDSLENPTKTFTGTTKIKDDTTIYAKWLQGFNVTYDMKDHGTQVEKGKVIEGEKITKPTDPTETGWTFKYWYKDDVNTAFDFNTIIDDNITLNALWEVKEYALSLNYNGGTLDTSVTAPTKWKYNESVTLPDISKITKIGYRPVGWYDNATFTGSAVTNIPENTEGPKTYYLKWEVKKFTVTFDSNGGSAVSPVEVVEGQKLAKPKEPTKTRMAFISWQKDGVDFDFNTAITTDINLVAKWQIANVVTFDTAGGSSISPINVATGSTLKKPANPTKSGYSFAGWTLDGENFNFATLINFDITLVATWNQNIVSSTSRSSGSSSGGGGGSSPSPSTGGPIPENYNKTPDLQIQQPQQPQQQQPNNNQQQNKAPETKVYVTKDSSNTKSISVNNSMWMSDPVSGKFRLSYINDRGQAELAHGFCDLSNPYTANEQKKSYYFNDKGELETGWVQTADNKWYFFDTNGGENFGNMVTGWKAIDGNWFYMNTDGSMMTDGVTPDGFTISSNGTWQQ